MENWITDFIEDFGYLGVFLMIALENIFPPIPSEIVLAFGGFATTTTDLTITGVIIASTLGSVVGALILYAIGMLLSVERLEQIIDRWGYILRLTRDDLAKADAWFGRFGIFTVFFCRMIPLVRSLISIPAGMAKMNFLLFLLFTTLGTIIWNTLLVNLGAQFGDAWPTIVEYFSIYSKIIYVVIALLIVGAVIWYIRRRRNFSA